jgi:hypothetical protein
VNGWGYDEQAESEGTGSIGACGVSFPKGASETVADWAVVAMPAGAAIA